LEAHPHARAVLEPALPPAGEPAHAYLFYGPSGTGKRTVARAFAAALLADGGAGNGESNDGTTATHPSSVAERVARGAHPDLTWIVPSGAREMLVGDVEEALVSAIARTPFESARRVFVLEDAQMMSDVVANRLLKTLEEPPSFAHIILLAQRPQDVPATVASRCQAVRFDALAPAALKARVRERYPELQDARAQACAQLAQGDGRLALALASEPGEALRAGAEQLVAGALTARTGERQWLASLEQARAAGTSAGAQLLAELQAELELLPAKEQRRGAREAGEAQRRVERRERTRALDETLRLAELWLRDVWLVAEGAPELVYAVDRLAELREHAAGRAPAPLRAGVQLIARTRLRLQAHVAEELALEALAYQLEGLLASSPLSPAVQSGTASSGLTRRSAASRSATTAA
jgi:DNA polymerase-3 subunit delta'